MSEPTPSSSKNTSMAAVAYFLFFVPLLTDAKDDPFVKYHVKQGLLLLILGIIVSIFNSIIGRIPFIGWIVSFVLGVGMFVLWLLGLMNALNGKQEPVPVVGQYAEEFFKLSMTLIARRNTAWLFYLMECLYTSIPHEPLGISGFMGLMQ